MAKLLAADASWEAANVAVQTHGGFGFAEDYDIERKFRETRLYQVAPISTNLILAYVAEHVLGLPTCRTESMALPARTGITVVSVEQAVAAPFATRQLADLGARVIKIERPDGGDFARGYDTTVNGLSSYFVWLNRSKESLTLDLKRPEARDVLARLLARADVFVQNLAPGAADRLGTAPAALRAAASAPDRLQRVGLRHRPGRTRGKKAYDLLVQSEVGLVSITGSERCAGQRRHLGRRHRRRHVRLLRASSRRCSRGRTTGEGTSLDVSLFDALGEWMGAAGLLHGLRRHGAAAQRREPRVDRAVRPVPQPATAARVFLGIQNAREWTRFCSDVLEPARARRRRALRTERAARAASRRAARRDRTGRSRTLTAATIVARLEVGRHRLRAHELGRRVPRAPAAAGARPLARDRLAGRTAARADAAGADGRRRAGDGRRAGARPAHRRDSRRARRSTRDTIAAWRKEGAI